MSDFHGDPKECASRKDKRCIWCSEQIARGDQQVTQSGRFDGRMYHNCYHPECWIAAAEGFRQGDNEFMPYSFVRGTSTS